MTKNVNIQHEESLSKLEQFALWLTQRVGTMGCFFLFCALVIFPLFVPSALTIVMFISSSFLQLVLLPLIMVGQNLQGRHAEMRAENDYEINIKAEQKIEEILRRLDEIKNK